MSPTTSLFHRLLAWCGLALAALGLVSTQLKAGDGRVDSTVLTRFIHDVEGRRVAKQVVFWNEIAQEWQTNTTRFLIDTEHPGGIDQRVAELGEEGKHRGFLRGLQPIAQVSDDGMQYSLFDGHGSVRGEVYEVGEVRVHQPYDSFGNPLSGRSGAGADSEGPGYAGEFWDAANGLQDLRARQYEPAAGRFRTVDTYEGRSEVPASLHKYAYVEQDPVNGTDPSGHESISSVFYSISASVYLFGQTHAPCSWTWCGVLKANAV